MMKVESKQQLADIIIQRVHPRIWLNIFRNIYWWDGDQVGAW